ncbi:hypothetical protein ACYOEI_01740 [Singulisphaera rosea]
MLSESWEGRLEDLIQGLIEDGGVSAASLASILVVAERARRAGYDVALCRRLWSAENELARLERTRNGEPAMTSPADVVRSNEGLGKSG